MVISWEAIDAAGSSIAADIAFGFVVIGIFCFLVVLIMAALITVRAVWRWITRQSWNSVIVSTERKALRKG